MAIEIVFTSKGPQLSIISEAARVKTNPWFPVIKSAKATICLTRTYWTYSFGAAVEL
jgi:hypothetical protein